MNLKTKLSALRKCVFFEGYCAGLNDDSGMEPFSRPLLTRAIRIANKLQLSIERDYQKWMIGWLERDEKLYEEMRKNEKEAS